LYFAPPLKGFSLELGNSAGGQKTIMMEVKGQGHQADLLIAPLTHQAAAVVSVGTYYYVASAGAAVGSAARGASAATDGREGRGISWRPLAYS